MTNQSASLILSTGIAFNIMTRVIFKGGSVRSDLDSRLGWEQGSTHLKYINQTKLEGWRDFLSTER